MCLMVHPFFSPSCGVRPHSRRSAVFLQSNSLEGLSHVSPMLLNRPETVTSDSKQKQTSQKTGKKTFRHLLTLTCFWCLRCIHLKYRFGKWVPHFVDLYHRSPLQTKGVCQSFPPSCKMSIPSFPPTKLPTDLTLASATQWHLLCAPNWDQNSLLSNHHLPLPIPAMKHVERNHVLHPETPTWLTAKL